MGKHTPLPSDPNERALEKKRRFAVYRRAWRKRQRAARNQKQADVAKKQRETERRLNFDLIS